MNTDGLNAEMRHLDYFGLRHNPFPVVPDVDNFYVCEHINRVVKEIVHGILTRKGFMVFTGEVGLGKTTISRKVINILEDKGVETSLVFHTFYQETELLREINRDFRLFVDDLVLSEQMKVLNDFLLSRNREGKNCAIIIDDAQNLNEKSLELVRMISNLETDQEKLVQILLIGQPELMDKLNSPELRQLKSRVMISEEARPLSQEELRGYTMFKLYMAGNTGRISVAENAMARLHRLTKGNFRQLNILMERCLYAAFLHNTSEIKRKIVNEAHRDLHPRRALYFKRPLAWGVLATLVLYLAGGALFPEIFFKVPWSNATDDEDMYVHSDMTQDRRLLPKSEETVSQQEIAGFRGAQAVPQEAEAETPIPDAVLDFLAAYGLSDYGRALYEAMEKDRLHDVADAIFEETGYQLLQMGWMPDNVKKDYGTLRFFPGQSQRESHLLFWKPKVRVTKFYLGYQGEEIRMLEEFLMGVELYDYNLDGIVGPKLMTAVNEFQQNMGLTITGFPDERTIFLLCHARG
jgi:general secretion pathway protein A